MTKGALSLLRVQASTYCDSNLPVKVGREPSLHLHLQNGVGPGHQSLQISRCHHSTILTGTSPDLSLEFAVKKSVSAALHHTARYSYRGNFISTVHTSPLSDRLSALNTFHFSYTTFHSLELYGETNITLAPFCLFTCRVPESRMFGGF